MFAIDVDPMTGLRLGTAGFWDVYGQSDPSTWVYRVSEYGPQSTRTRMLPAAAVIHCRYATAPLRPWVGRPPVAFAGLTSELMRRLEQALGYESNFVTAQVVPEGGPVGDDLTTLKADLTNLEGSLAMPETMAGGAGDRGARPDRDWEQRRLGPAPPAAEVRLRTDVERTILSACGIPPGLMDAQAGASGRESFRQLLYGTLSPIARLVAQELSEKLGVPGLRFNFDDLGAADVSGRARAYQSLRGAGMEAAQASRIAGVE